MINPAVTKTYQHGMLVADDSLRLGAQTAMHAALQAFGDSTWERKFAVLAEQASQVGLTTLQVHTSTLAEGSVKHGIRYIRSC